jgi:hypothetical protein
LTKRGSFHSAQFTHPSNSQGPFFFLWKLLFFKKYRDRDSVKWADGTDEPKRGQVVRRRRRRLSVCLSCQVQGPRASFLLFFLLIRTF